MRDAGRWSVEQPAPLHDQDIWYRTNLAGRGRHTLRFHGLATLAEVWLNGTLVLASDNMFLMREVEVDLLGSNELLIAFRSLDRELDARRARRMGRARWRTRLVDDNTLRLVRTTLLGHMPGWQPPIHAVGPWRGIEMIDETGPIQVRAVEMQARLEGNDGLLTVELEIDCNGVRPSAMLQVGDGACPLTWVDDRRLEGTLRVPKVDRWWPHTHGVPTLYRVQVRLGDVEIDLGRTGFRSLEVDRGADGKGFGLKVNGQKIFARGVCWSAVDLVSLAGGRAQLSPWLEQVRAAHMNMIRVGGTMIYESDDFFALCDELGILVWHDFMFANMDYPVGDAAFRTSVVAEATQFLRRTQGHPALAVVCGGSEVAQQAAMFGLPPSAWSSPLHDDILPRAAAELRADVIYVAQSPMGGDVPFATDSGVSHYYGVGAYLRPLEDARRSDVRFASECLAFANVPAANSAGVPWTDSVRWKAAVPRDHGAAWDFEYVRDHYLRLLYGVDPVQLRTDDPARYLRLSRVATAEVMEVSVAEWRRAGSSCDGAIVWMLKDFMPGAGWGVVDSTGAPKLAWHGLRRAFRPVQVGLTDEGLNGLGIHLANDTAVVVRARLTLLCLQGGERVVMRREREGDLPARGNLTLSSADVIGAFFDITYAYRFGTAPLDATIVTLDDAGTGARLSDAIHFPLGRAALDVDPGLSVEPILDEAGWTLRLLAIGLATSIQIEDVHYRAEDEGFHLLPGEERIVRLLKISGPEGPPAGRVFSGGSARGVPYRGAMP
ncbi:MAG: glycoside hydrolase family 2 protein [Reyranella sp.]|nr:glycoside hydrolase family 2 protein [Reyranella sp.]